MKLKTIFIALYSLLTACLWAQESGSLKNGMEYHLLHNKTSKGRATLWLVLKVGMLNESASQKGFAHLVEHLAWNNTKNLRKQQIEDEVELLIINDESEANISYTAMDSTIFKLNISLNQPLALERGIFLLKEVATSAILSKEALDEEKNEVSQETIDAIKNPNVEKFEKQLAVLLQCTDKILTQEVVDSIKNATLEQLQDFYNSKYRPDQMALIAVGDFDEASLKETIDRFFGSIEKPTTSLPEVTNKVIKPGEYLLLLENNAFELPKMSMTYLLPSELSGDFQQLLLPSIQHHLESLVNEGIILSHWNSTSAVSVSHQILEIGIVLFAFDKASILDTCESFVQVMRQIEHTPLTYQENCPARNESHARSYADRFLGHPSSIELNITDGLSHEGNILKDCPKVITIAYKP